jgi:cellulose biosynthesis protein BcsQ
VARIKLVAKKPHRVVLFNHKGGVGKTTLTVNIARALVDAGKRVLMVDTDPQCSLSSFFLEEKYLDKMLDQSEADDGNTVWSALKPVSEGTGLARPITSVKISERLFLAVGDIRLSNYENSLADSWSLCLGRNRRGYNVTAALSKVVDHLVAATKADYVFFDAGPNIGPLNRALLLDCTHFIVPAACDLFSTRAIKTLGFALSEWVATWERVQEMAPENSPVLAGRPKLLGYIPQGFRVYRGEMAKAPFSRLINLEDRVVEFVWKPLQEAMGLPVAERPSNLRLGEVKYFGTLVTTAQNQGLPLWEVTGGDARAKNDARQIFSGIAKRLP